MLTDYHMHLQPDGVEARAAAEDTWGADGGHLSAAWIGRYVARARSRAVAEIAVTEHVHRFSEARDWLDNPWWQGEATEDIDTYCDALVAAREEHGLPVLVGIEMDWLPDRQERIAAFVNGRPFDIVLGSVHWLGAFGVDHPDFPAWDGMSAEAIWDAYLEQLVAAAQSGLFDVLAHPDLPKVFGHSVPRSARARWDDVVAAIAETGIAIECSSAGLRKPAAELYPDPGLLGQFCRAGVPVTLASDAHAPQDVARDFPTAAAALRIAGYETITRFTSRQAEQVPVRWA